MIEVSKLHPILVIMHEHYSQVPFKIPCQVFIHLHFLTISKLRFHVQFMFTSTPWSHEPSSLCKINLHLHNYFSFNHTFFYFDDNGFLRLLCKYDKTKCNKMNAMVTLQCLQSYIKKRIKKRTSNEILLKNQQKIWNMKFTTSKIRNNKNQVMKKIYKSMSNKNNTQMRTNNECYKKHANL